MDPGQPADRTLELLVESRLLALTGAALGLGLSVAWSRSEVNPAKNGYTVPRVGRFYSDLAAQIRATPGVSAAAYAWVPLLRGWLVALRQD